MNQASSGLQIIMLGSFVVKKGKQTLPRLPYEKLEGFFAYLCFHANQEVNKEELLGLFWGEKEEQKAKSNLRQAVYNLKKHLHFFPEIKMNSNRKTVSLSFPSNTFFDWKILLNAPKNRTLQDVETLQALFQGVFLQNVHATDAEIFSEWLEQKRREYQKKHYELLLRLLKNYEEQHLFEKKIEICQKLLQLNPWDETIHLQLMKSWVLQDQRTLAIQHFRTIEKAFQVELKLQLSKDLVVYYQELVKNQHALPSESTSNRELLAWKPKTALPHFSGISVVRKEEKQVLLWLQEGNQVIHVRGIGGIGKTHFICSVAKQIQDLYPEGVFFIAFHDSILVTVLGSDGTKIQALGSELLI